MKFIIFVALVGLVSGQIVPEPRNAQVVPELRNGCRQSHTLTNVGQSVQIRSPNWPRNYPNNANCRYHFTSPRNTLIDFECSLMNIEHESNCIYDKLSVFLSGDDRQASAARNVCGRGTYKGTSTFNKLIVRFTTDESNPRSLRRYRFNCKATVIPNPSAPSPNPQLPLGPSGEFANTTCTCGTRNEATRIVGGVDAIQNEFPWRVAVVADHVCGGTIISPNWVLTAAHCIDPGEELSVLIGAHNYDGQVEDIIKCKRVIEHPQYNDETMDNDIALCQLERPLKFSRNVQPICLPWNMLSETFQGKTVTASGWGTTSHGGQSPSTLRKVDLPILTTSECRRYLGSDITDNMICTYQPGRDTCQGDSGGSIDYRDPTTGRYFGIGIVSFGYDCAAVDKPGVYVKMTNFMSWIQANTGENFCR